MSKLFMYPHNMLVAVTAQIAPVPTITAGESGVARETRAGKGPHSIHTASAIGTRPRVAIVHYVCGGEMNKKRPFRFKAYWKLISAVIVRSIACPMPYSRTDYRKFSFSLPRCNN